MPKKTRCKPNAKGTTTHQPSPVIAWSLICFVSALIAITVYVGVNSLVVV